MLVVMDIFTAFPACSTCLMVDFLLNYCCLYWKKKGAIYSLMKDENYGLYNGLFLRKSFSQAYVQIELNESANACVVE